MADVAGLGHLGIICDDLMKMRDFYTRVIGLTITDENLETGSIFLSADPQNEHHELNLGQSRGPDDPRDARPRTQNVGQVSFVVNSLEGLRNYYHVLQAEKANIVRTVTHGISVSIYFHDPEENIVELYYKTGFNVRQGMGEHVDLDDSDEELLSFSKSFEAIKGPFRGPQIPVEA